MSKLRTVILTLSRDTGGLSQRIARGGMWVGSSFALGKLFSTAQQIILARLLLPSDFGLFGIALLAIGTLEAFTQTGVEVALVQRREITDRILNTGWILSVLRAFFLTFLIYLTGPHVATFFKAPKPALFGKCWA